LLLILLNEKIGISLLYFKTMKIAFFSTKPYDRDYFDKINQDFGHDLTYFEPALSSTTKSLAKDFEGVCAFVNDELNREILESLLEEGVKLVCLRCAGFNNVDLEAADELGIVVLRVPAYSPNAVAEHAIALIMTLNRKTHKAYNRVRENNFSLERLIGFDLHGKNVGVIGTGKIGKEFVKIVQGFGCNVLANDKYPDDELKASGLRYVSLNELFQDSHIISLHCPLTPETNHIINQENLEQMKRGVMLINTSRGGLIDTQAVIQALKKRKLGYLGIDVYEQEEDLFFKDLSETVIEDDTISRLMTFPNVLITAHQAFLTDNALTNIAEVSLQNISEFEERKALTNQVDASFLK